MSLYTEFGGNYTINNQKVFGRKIFINIDDFEKMDATIKRFKNIDVYCTNYIYDDADQNNSKLIGPLYLDFDYNIENNVDYSKVKIDTLFGINYLNLILHIPKDFIRIYFSGNKGFHLIVSKEVLGIIADKQLNVKFKKIAKEIYAYTLNKTIDTKIYDKKRLIRLAHSINGKTGLYKVPITEEQLRNFSYDEMKIYASEDKVLNYKMPILVPEARKAFYKKTDIEIVTKKPSTNANLKNIINPNFEIPICVKNIYNDGAIKGQRNNTLIILASSILQKGVSIEECLEIVKQWNIEKNEEPLDDAEIENTVNSAYRSLLEGKKYGCSSIADLGLCVGAKCKIYKQ